MGNNIEFSDNLNPDTMNIRVHGEGSQRDPMVIELKVKVDHIEKSYVTRQEFMPVKMLVYGMTALIQTGVIIAILKLINVTP